MSISTTLALVGSVAEMMDWSSRGAFPATARVPPAEHCRLVICVVDILCEAEDEVRRVDVAVPDTRLVEVVQALQGLDRDLAGEPVRRAAFQPLGPLQGGVKAPSEWFEHEAEVRAFMASVVEGVLQVQDMLLARMGRDGFFLDLPQERNFFVRFRSGLVGADLDGHILV
jgi:hypothetical protein